VTQVDERPAAAGHVPGEPGLWVFLGGDLLLFGVLFTTYLGSRSGDPEPFAQSQALLHTDIGVINTLLLLTSSLCVVLALRASRSGPRAVAPRLVAVALACGLGFVALKAVEYHREVAAGADPSRDDFFLWYFILTGLHLGHVIIGLGLLTLVLATTRSGEELQPGTRRVVEGCACFWHLVDLLWLVLFPLLYLIA
jgi:nitric oxide reductase NorE protein